VLIEVGGIRQRSEVEAWSFLEVRIRIPALVLEKPAAARLLIERADGQSAGPIELQIVPHEAK
jgi:hypothetical protein